MADTQTLQDMQSALAHYRAGKAAGGAAVAPAAPAAPAPAPTGSTGSTGDTSGIGASLAAYKAQKASGTAPTTIPKDNPSLLASFAKSLFGAPATLLARPVQAVAELAGASADQVDAATSKIPIVGSLVAPVDRNFGDVKKDVGRAAETVALGTGAPIAGGALFGAGASLEAGNNLFSAQTAVDAALGGAGGKVLDWVGKPLLNAAGTVVGKITPKIIQDVTKQGAGAIAKFAADHQLLGGIAAKPSAAIASGLQKVDTALGAGVSKLAGGTKSVLKDQFPGLNPTEHYTAVNEKDFLRPTTVNEPRFSKAQSVYSDAQNRGINLEKQATAQGIVHDLIAEGGKYNTTDTVENLREGNYRASDSLVRPAIKAAEPGVRLVPLSEVRAAQIAQIRDIPKTQIDDTDRATLMQQVIKRYAPGGAADVAHPNGYSLTDLHDARIISQKNGKYKIGGTSSDALSAQRSREEGRAFNTIFDKTAPKDLPIKGFKSELEKNFLLADYLEQLHGKKVPEGITKKAVRLFGRGLGGVLGSKIGGFPGFLVGSRGGDMIFNSFETLPNPIKIKVLQSVKKEDPAVYAALVKYIGTKEAEAMDRLALPGPGQTAKAPAPTLFATPGGTITPDKGAAADLTAVEQGRAKTPTTNRTLKSYLTKAAQAQDTSRQPYVRPSELPVINAGRVPKKPKNLSDIYLK